MRFSFVRLQRPATLLVLVASLAACTEPSSMNGAARPTSTQQIVTRLLVTDSTDQSVVLVLSLEMGGDASRIGSFTARVTYDSVGLGFLEEVPTSDGALRALNPTSGLVRIAGASTLGMEATRLAALRFRVRNPQAIGSAQLVLEELHGGGQTRADLHALLRRSPGPTP
jgi:hypothetical protein